MIGILRKGIGQTEKLIDLTRQRVRGLADKPADRSWQTDTVNVDTYTIVAKGNRRGLIRLHNRPVADRIDEDGSDVEASFLAEPKDS